MKCNIKMQYKLYYRHFYDISESLPDSSKNDYDTILLSSFYFLMLMYLLLLNHDQFYTSLHFLTTSSWASAKAKIPTAF